MEKENIVSIWVGNFENEEKFHSYIMEIYDDEGDSGSKFMEDFNIDYIDIQFQESAFFNEEIKLSTLNNASYFNSFSEKLSEIDFKDSNSIILLYDFEFDKKIVFTDNVRFLGSFQYKK